VSRYPTKGPGDLPEPTNVPGSPAYDDSREEWIAERADELFDERMASPEAVTDAVEEVIGFTEFADTLPDDMAAVLMASDAAFEAEAVRFFARLHWRVSKDIRDAAEADAESERDRWEEEQEEMRSGADLRGWAA
jgi:hypothetical protein